MRSPQISAAFGREKLISAAALIRRLYGTKRNYFVTSIPKG